MWDFMLDLFGITNFTILTSWLGIHGRTANMFFFKSAPQPWACPDENQKLVKIIRIASSISLNNPIFRSIPMIWTLDGAIYSGRMRNNRSRDKSGLFSGNTRSGMPEYF